MLICVFVKHFYSEIHEIDGQLIIQKISVSLIENSIQNGWKILVIKTNALF